MTQFCSGKVSINMTDDDHLSASFSPHSWLTINQEFSESLLLLLPCPRHPSNSAFPQTVTSPLQVLFRKHLSFRVGKYSLQKNNYGSYLSKTLWCSLKCLLTPDKTYLPLHTVGCQYFLKPAFGKVFGWFSNAFDRVFHLITKIFHNEIVTVDRPLHLHL